MAPVDASRGGGGGRPSTASGRPAPVLVLDAHACLLLNGTSRTAPGPLPSMGSNQGTFSSAVLARTMTVLLLQLRSRKRVVTFLCFGIVVIALGVGY
jgi:hypothetical protein